jgi:prophage regulatory protein
MIKSQRVHIPVLITAFFASIECSIASTLPHERRTLPFVRGRRRLATHEDLASISSASVDFNRVLRETEAIDMARQNTMSMRRTIRRHQLREIVPLADSTIYEMEQRGEFPRRFALSPRCVVWDLGEVEAWLSARRSAPTTRAPHPDVRRRRTRPVKAQDQAAGSASKVE